MCIVTELTFIYKGRQKYRFIIWGVKNIESLIFSQYLQRVGYFVVEDQNTHWV